MADRQHLPQDLAWYQDRWEELMDLLPATDPEEVVDHIRELQVSVLDEEAQALDDMGLADADEAKTVLRRIFERLQELRRKNQNLQRAQAALDVANPDDLVARVESLQDRVDAFEEQQAQLADAGFEEPAHLLEALRSMEEQLNALYDEKEATERTEEGTPLKMEGDIFEQLQALMAREEKLQRELGVSNPDAVVEMVEGLSDQLDELYQDRDADTTSDSIFAPATAASPSAEDTLEEEFGTSDPDTITIMMEDLTQQLDELYAERERLAELDLNGTGDAVEMVKSMQLQLESLYESREEMSQHGISNVDHALSMIENMEEQLNDLYDERHQLATEKGISSPDEALSQLEALEEELSALLEEKKSLREKRDQLEAQLSTLQDELGLDDPAAIPDLVQSLEDQLQETYAEQDASASAPKASAEEPLLDADTRARLDDMDEEALEALPVGLFQLDDEGSIRHATSKALQWPDVSAASAEVLVGQNFFFDVAPGTDNTLFRGRFSDGVAQEDLDTQFAYTYVSGDTPPANLVVQLYSSAPSTHWLAFAVLEQY